MNTSTTREYLVRVTRHPLEPVTREQMRVAGTLPEDYRSRSIEATDFVKVQADSDEQAREYAKDATSLVIKGESVEFHEVTGDGEYRVLEARQEVTAA